MPDFSHVMIKSGRNPLPIIILIGTVVTAVILLWDKIAAFFPG